MINELRAAFGFLTIFPIGAIIDQPGRAMAYFPLVGLVIGVLLAGVRALPFLPAEVAAFLTLVTWVVVTGGLHLDGFADACDGLFATTSPARRLEIMRDPRVGTWGVVGVVLLLLGKFVLLGQVAAPTLLVLPPVLGRLAMVAAAWAFPYARSQGLGAYFRQGLGRVQVITAALTAAVVLGVFVVVTGRVALLPGLLIVALMVAVLLRWSASRLDGGLTGDVYGMACEVTELLVLLWII